MKNVQVPLVFRIGFAVAASALLLTGGAKLLSVGDNSRFLERLDPLFGIPIRLVLLSIGGIEVAIALVCCFSNQFFLRAGLVAWLSTNFVAYKIGLAWIGFGEPCPCLGNLSGALPISVRVADSVMQILMITLLALSYGGLLWTMHTCRRTHGVPN